jgi:hypothetical protein
LITNKGKWKKGIRIAWDWGMEQENEIQRTIESLSNAGYACKDIIVFVLVNWKIPFSVCEAKLRKLREWGVMVDDCTYDCTKRRFIPDGWAVREYRIFRRMCRDHNIEIPRRGYNPGKKQQPAERH